MANVALEGEGVPITLPNPATRRGNLLSMFSPRIGTSPLIGFTPRFDVGKQLGEGSYGVVNVCQEKLTRQLSKQPSYGATKSRLSSATAAAAAIAVVDGATNGGADAAGSDSDEENGGPGAERPEICTSVARVEATEAALLAAGNAEGKPDGPAEPPAAGRMYACKTVDKIPLEEKATQKRLSARELEVRVNALKHEIQVLKHVGYHPNIVAVVGVYNNEKRLRLVMELCDAGDALGLLMNPPKKPTPVVENECADVAAANGPKPEHQRGKSLGKFSQFFKALAKSPIDPKPSEAAARNGTSNNEVKLSETVLESGLTERQVALMFLQLIRAVEHCHSRNVIHRDIKLENVLLNNCRCSKCKPEAAAAGAANDKNRSQQPKQGQQQGKQQEQTRTEPSSCSGYVVKLADFGLAKLLQPTQTMATGNKGSQLYKAPEVAQGRWYTTQADMWSLGVVLYALLSARFPPRDKEGMVAFDAVSDERLLFKGRSWKGVSAGARGLVYALLSWESKHRPSCQAVYDDQWMAQHCK